MAIRSVASRVVAVVAILSTADRGILKTTSSSPKSATATGEALVSGRRNLACE